MTIELTTEEQALCEALSLQKQIVELRAELAKADQIRQATEAKSELERYWALSASASVTSHYRRGATRAA